MDYYERIQKAVYFIEENLQEELNIIDIAAKSYFSPFHFQRLFQAISGFSVKEYIRNRRLSEAAVSLLETDRPILDIAMDFQYGSQEAFSRAFSHYFGITPAKYRKAKVKLDHQAKMNFLDYKNKMNGELIMTKPKIMHLDEIHIIGYEYRTNLNNETYFEEIPGFYFDFGQNEYYLKIQNKAAPSMSYGVSCNFQDEGEFSFIIGEAVHAPAEEVPEPLVYFKIPEGKYAIFDVKGPSASVQNTRRFIYGTWLPNSNYERKEGPDFEVTDVCQSSYPDDMRMKVYIPIR
ncbi:effector binding domain-containing protein [Bacillus sp. z60-18]|uniref:effector binding domain-containing protein n=1 Tax=unclassified Bacillus (in: firmicutes) TaxID=185979 RepID=UPI00390CD5AC